MPLFECSACHCYENTALSNWAIRHMRENRLPDGQVPPALCSACDPKIGEWHGQFPQLPARGMVREIDDKNRFLYHDEKEARALNARGRLEVVQ